MGNNFCPVSGRPLSRSCLVLNKTLQWSIQSWAAQEHIRLDSPSKKERHADVPQQFRCPLTLECMDDPVITIHSINFERCAILKWLNEYKTCPVTSKPLDKSGLFPDTRLQAAIDEWFLKSSSASSLSPLSSSIIGGRTLQSPHLSAAPKKNSISLGELRHPRHGLSQMYSTDKVDRFKQRFSKDNVIAALDEAIYCSSFSK